ncbi:MULTISPECIES: hypothetical protein [Halostella]|uniref:DUF7285 family protein n=1 Tax=Halostella TaxID=1843185 RepID=UPI0010803E3F|nr:MULTISPECIES: hypothetical protein [Halostella]
MSHWSARRAQTEPLAVLAALFVVGTGLALYAGAVDTTLGVEEDRGADPTLRRVWNAVSEAGVLAPANLSDGLDAAPDGREIRITVTGGASVSTQNRTDSAGEDEGEIWTAGPEAPPDAVSASRSASVRVGPGRIRAGRLRVEVWS